MRRLERLYAISDELRRLFPRPVSATTLAERFDVTRRTIERDISALRSAGVPIGSRPGHLGGLVLSPLSARTVLTFTPAEVTALLVAVTVCGESPYSGASSAAVSKLLQALPDERSVAVDQLRQRLRVVPRRGRAVPARVRDAVESAAQGQRQLKIVYRDRNAVETRRVIEPHGFYADSDSWNIIGWCTLRTAPRLFRLDRITQARMLQRQFPTRDIDELLGWVPEFGIVPSLDR